MGLVEEQAPMTEKKRGRRRLRPCLQLPEIEGYL